ncbi:hypothetical protein H072_3388 [Dactylellina haptotyla CBS 200.50]|uniref:Uncharacterized protein n=1 Tax=Dactylellina haptotyla (strain CBS 200.50) TaxID=1284197 RepID=S8AN56_DACHA|nr:hypothetical protein H072_3388 [Dactylellina haptotyla CBS 200.50]
MLIEASANAWQHGDYTVGWLCALPKEQTAATVMLDETHPSLDNPVNDSNHYTVGSIGGHNIVITCLPLGPLGKHGTISATVVAQQMARTFSNIKTIFLIGIGGGIPANKVRLGDVVVSTPVGVFPGVVQWDLGKTGAGGQFERVGCLNGPPMSVLTALSKLQVDHEIKGSKIPEYLDNVAIKYPKVAGKYLKSKEMEDVLFKSTYAHVEQPPVDSQAEDEEYDEDEDETSCRWCDRSKVVKRKPRDMLIHYGLIASGNQVVKDAALRNDLNQELSGQLLCIEMEAAGLMSNFPCIVIRGICNYADSHKNDDWEQYAAIVAAAFAKELLGYVQPDEVKRERALKDQLDEIMGEISQLQKDVQNIRLRSDKKEDIEILNWLTPHDYGPQQTDLIRRRQKGTGAWFLDSPEFQHWLATPNEILFCPGIPGAGKTIVCATAIDHVLRIYGEDENSAVAYIYFGFKSQNLQSPERILASILKQLCRNYVPDSVKTLYESHKKKGTEPLLEEIFELLVSVAALYSRVFILADAIDECESSNGYRRLFLSQISKLQSLTQMNFLATSRKLPDITTWFEEKQATKLEIFARTEDIKVFVENRLSLIEGAVQYDQGLQEEVKSKISERIDGMFLLVQLRLDSLNNKASPSAVRNALKTQATGTNAYDAAYRDAIETISIEADGTPEVMKALSWIVRAKRQLTTQELGDAIAVETGTKELDRSKIPAIVFLVSKFRGIVTIEQTSGIIRLVHHTAQEFFDRTWMSWFPRADLIIGYSCLTYLLYDDFKAGVCGTTEGLAKRMEEYALYNYAANNWGNHKSVDGSELVLEFFANQGCMSASCEILGGPFEYNEDKTFADISSVHMAAFFGLPKTMGMLLEQGADIETPTSLERTPLSFAAENKQVEMVDFMINKGASLEARDLMGWTSLRWALREKRNPVVGLLTSRGADVNSKDDITHQTPLLSAIFNNDSASVRSLLEHGADLNLEITHKWLSPLWVAVHEMPNEEIIALLLEHGADFEIQLPQPINLLPKILAMALQPSGRYRSLILTIIKMGSLNIKSISPVPMTILEAAISHFPWTDLVKAIVETGVSSEILSGDGKPPLIAAVEIGSQEVVKFLIAKEFDVNAKWNYQTPLHIAARIGDPTFILLLIANGANLEARDDKDRTPLLVAIEHGHEKAALALVAGDAVIEPETTYPCEKPIVSALNAGWVRLVNGLLLRGADSEARTTKGESILQVATKHCDLGLVQYILLSKPPGMDVNEKDADGLTPMHLAIKHSKIPDYGIETVLNLLKLHGANLAARDNSKRAPLHIAAMYGNTRAIKSLIPWGADIHAIASFGRMPLHFAAEYGRMEAVSVLCGFNAWVEAWTSYGCTPLHLAVIWGHPQTVGALVNHGASIEARSWSGQTPLHLAAISPYSARTIPYLGQRWPSPLSSLAIDIPNKKEKTAINLAVQLGNITAISFRREALGNMCKARLYRRSGPPVSDFQIHFRLICGRSQDEKLRLPAQAG